MAVELDDIEIHELASALPRMPEDEFQGLVDSISEVGLLEPIKLFQGKIIDGIHRHQACIRAGVRPQYELWSGTDPAAYVLAQNLHRRHLDKQQRTAAALAVLSWKSRGGISGAGSGKGAKGVSAEEVAKVSDSSISTVKAVKRAVRAGDATLDEIVQGTKSAFDSNDRVLDNKPKDGLKPADKQARKIEQLQNQLHEKVQQINELEDIVESYQRSTTGDEKQRVLYTNGLNEKIRTLELNNANLSDKIRQRDEYINVLKGRLNDAGIGQ